MLRTNLGRLRIIGFLEGVSFILLLGIGMPLKYLADMGMPNKVMGQAHGFLFIAYVVMVFLVREEKKWNLKTTGLALLASLVPLGPFFADAYLFKEKKG